jgi:hypothetical protein
VRWASRPFRLLIHEGIGEFSVVVYADGGAEEDGSDALTGCADCAHSALAHWRAVVYG